MSDPLPIIEMQYDYQFAQGDEIDGKYKVINPLGHGGFSEVYKCEHLEIPGVHVAVKLILQWGPEVQREAQTAFMLIHPHIVRATSIGRLDEKSQGYIVMDYVEGQTLETKLNELEAHRLPFDDQTLTLIDDVAQALDFAHSKGTIHRDVKPSNILLSKDGTAFLSDFGLSETKRLPGQSVFSQHSQAGLSGTYPYMSPEQLMLKDSGSVSDLYSLGVVVYEILTGQLPYRGRQMMMMRNIMDGDIVPPTQLDSELRKGVETVLLKMLSHNPEDRYQTGAEFVKALRYSSRAYRTAERLYSQALEAIKGQDWRRGLADLERLEQEAPDYKEARFHLDKARHQIRLLEMFEDATALLNNDKYEQCLEKLRLLQEIEPSYPVAELEQAATAGIEYTRKEQAKRLYTNASTMYRLRRFEDANAALAEIAKLDPVHPDPQDLRPKVKAELEQLRKLKSLYDAGVRALAQNQWPQAQQRFEELLNESPNYPDATNRLAMARQMVRLSNLMEQATARCQDGAYAECVDDLDELVHLDQHYEAQRIEQLRQEALNLFYNQAQTELKGEQFEQSLSILEDLHKRAPEYGDPSEVERQAREGIAARDLRMRLDKQYEQALELEHQREYEESLALWAEIREADENYPDSRDLERHARGRWADELVHQIVNALDTGAYQQALELCNTVRTQADPNDPRIGRLEQKARRLKEDAESGEARERRLAGWFRQAQLALDKRDPQQALRLCGQIGSEQQDYPGLAEVRIKAQRMQQRREAKDKLLVFLKTCWQWLIKHRIPVFIVIAVILLALLLWQLVPRVVTWIQNRPTPTPTSTLAPTSTNASVALATNTVTRQPEGTATPTPSATATGTATLVPTATRTTIPTATSTQAPTAAPTATSKPTATRQATATVQPTQTPIPTLGVGSMATASQDVSILVAPVYPSTQVDFILQGGQAEIIGRAPESFGEWFYVKADNGIEGYAYAPYFDWDGEVEILPTVRPTVTVIPPTSAVPVQIERVWWTSRCVSGGWEGVFDVKVRGGTGQYTFYWDDILVEAEPKPSESGAYIVVRPGVEGMIVGTIRVLSGGQEDSMQTSAKRPTSCQ